VIQFHACGVRQHSLQIWRIETRAGAKANEMLVPPAIRNLDETQPVPPGDKTHCFGIDSDRALGKYAFGEIFFVEIDSHMAEVLRPIAALGKVPVEGALRIAMTHDNALPESWRLALDPVLATAESQQLSNFLKAEEFAGKRIYPPPAVRLRALELTPLDQVKVVILGQDPYHSPGQAHGLSFSVPEGVKVPPSLANIYKEIASDLGIAPPSHGNLEHWARQGVLLLNNALTVEEGQAGSHQKHGWEAITDAAISAVAQRNEPTVFLLWGNHARRKAERIPGLRDGRHLVLMAPHPSPLSAHSGFFGCRHFSNANAFLMSNGRGTIDWQLAPSPFGPMI